MQTRAVILVSDDSKSRQTLMRKLVGAGYSVSAHSRDYLHTSAEFHSGAPILLIVLEQSDTETSLRGILRASEQKDSAVVFTGSKMIPEQVLGHVRRHHQAFVPIEASAKDFATVFNNTSFVARSLRRERSMRKIKWAISAFSSIARAQSQPEQTLKGILGALSAVTQSRCELAKSGANESSFSPSKPQTGAISCPLDGKGLWQLRAVPKNHKSFSDDDFQILMMAGAICSNLV